MVWKSLRLCHDYLLSREVSRTWKYTIQDNPNDHTRSTRGDLLSSMEFFSAVPVIRCLKTVNKACTPVEKNEADIFAASTQQCNHSFQVRSNILDGSLEFPPSLHHLSLHVPSLLLQTFSLLSHCSSLTSLHLNTRSIHLSSLISTIHLATHFDCVGEYAFATRLMGLTALELVSPYNECSVQCCRQLRSMTRFRGLECFSAASHCLRSPPPSLLCTPSHCCSMRVE